MIPFYDKTRGTHGYGLAADRPAANEVWEGSFYCASDTGVIYRSNGTTWDAVATSATSGINQLTGDVTAGPGSGSQVATIPNDTVTYAKMQNISAASKLLGRGSASGSGDTQEITIGTGLSMSGTTLNNTITDTGITQLTGDVTAGPGSGSQAATIANDAVTNAKLANMAQSTIKGRAAAAGTGDPTDLTADQTSTILDGATDPFLRTSVTATGSFTPVIGGSGGTSGQSYTTQIGRYTKVGKLVSISITVQLSNKGTITGNVQIQNLPYAVANITAYQPFFLCAWGQLATNWVNMGCYGNPTVSVLAIEGISAAGPTLLATALATADITNTTIFRITGLYFTD